MKINNETLNYSVETEVDYKKEMIVVSEDLKIKELSSGFYFINVYFEKELI